MPLDHNLYTLYIKRSEEEPSALDLADPQGILRYRRRPYRAPKNPQDDASTSVTDPLARPAFEVFDPLSNGLLATLHVNPATANKKRVIELHNPSAAVDLTFVGTMGFKWQFEWETHTFEFKKGEIHLNRKPDPSIMVAIWELDKKQQSAQLGFIQLLDHNLGRFDVDDRKGLEIVMIAGILAFQDSTVSETSAPARSAPAPAPNVANPSRGRDPPLPPPPPKDIISEITFMQKQERVASNELVVTPDFSIAEFAEFAAKLLSDPNMLYIVLKSKSEAEVPKVVAIAEETKRIRYRGGAYDEDLNQYVRYDDENDDAKKKGPRVIRLDEPANKDSTPKDYRPPTTLTIHLSKIPMPELQPKAKPTPQPAASTSASTSITSTIGNFLRPRPDKGNKNGARPVSMHTKSDSSSSTRPPPRHRRSSPSPPRSTPDSSKANKKKNKDTPSTAASSANPPRGGGTSRPSPPSSNAGRRLSPSQPPPERPRSRSRSREPRPHASNAPSHNNEDNSSGGAGRFLGFSRPNVSIPSFPTPSVPSPQHQQRYSPPHAAPSPVVPGSYPSFYASYMPSSGQSYPRPHGHASSSSVPSAAPPGYTPFAPSPAGPSPPPWSRPNEPSGGATGGGLSNFLSTLTSGGSNTAGNRGANPGAGGGSSSTAAMANTIANTIMDRLAAQRR